MKIEYELSLDDLSEGTAIFSNKDLWNGRWPRLLKKSKKNLIYGSIILGVTIFATYLSHQLKWAIFGSIYLCIYVGIYLVHKQERFSFQKFFVMKMYSNKNLRGNVGKHKLEITDSEFIESTDFNENKIQIENIFGVRESSEYLFVLVNDILVHIIPKLKISEEQRDKIRKMVEKSKYVDVTATGSKL